MDPQKITKLAKLLKSEGDKVLNNEYKLTLSGECFYEQSNNLFKHGFSINNQKNLIHFPNQRITFTST